MPEKPVTSIERLRETVSVRVQATSLRAVARQVGMSPSGLEKFLAGGTPYSRSRQRLQEWWVREGSRPRSDVSSEGIEVAIGALVRDLPADRREDAIRRMVRALRSVYEAQGCACPPWLARLSQNWLPDPPLLHPGAAPEPPRDPGDA